MFKTLSIALILSQAPLTVVRQQITKNSFTRGGLDGEI